MIVASEVLRGTSIARTGAMAFRPAILILLASSGVVTSSCVTTATKVARAPTAQAFLDDHFLPRDGNVRQDGGVLINAHFTNVISQPPWRARKALLVYCEGKGGHLEHTATAQTSAAQLGGFAMSMGMLAPRHLPALTHADENGAFGSFACMQGGAVRWRASIEPRVVTRGPSDWGKLQVLAKAFEGDAPQGRGADSVAGAAYAAEPAAEHPADGEEAPPKAESQKHSSTVAPGSGDTGMGSSIGALSTRDTPKPLLAVGGPYSLSQVFDPILAELREAAAHGGDRAAIQGAMAAGYLPPDYEGLSPSALTDPCAAWAGEKRVWGQEKGIRTRITTDLLSGRETYEWEEADFVSTPAETVWNSDQARKMLGPPAVPSQVMRCVLHYRTLVEQALRTLMKQGTMKSDALTGARTLSVPDLGVAARRAFWSAMNDRVSGERVHDEVDKLRHLTCVVPTPTGLQRGERELSCGSYRYDQGDRTLVKDGRPFFSADTVDGVRVQLLAQPAAANPAPNAPKRKHPRAAR
jgi:hypothetical protein